MEGSGRGPHWSFKVNQPSVREKSKLIELGTESFPTKSCRNHLAERRNGNSIRNPKDGKWPLFSGVSERLEEGPRVLYQ
jgi:hypothetical protein